MEVDVNAFFPYLAAIVYFLFQDWFKKIPKEWYLSAAIIIPILVIFFPLKIHANIIRLILESLLLILAYHVFSKKLSVPVTLGIFLLSGILMAILIFC